MKEGVGAEAGGEWGAPESYHYSKAGWGILGSKDVGRHNKEASLGNQNRVVQVSQSSCRSQIQSRMMRRIRTFLYWNWSQMTMNS